jgi:hypothetical protein
VNSAINKTEAIRNAELSTAGEEGIEQGLQKEKCTIVIEIVGRVWCDFAGFFDILNGLMLEDFLVSEMSTTYETFVHKFTNCAKKIFPDFLP